MKRVEADAVHDALRLHSCGNGSGMEGLVTAIRGISAAK